MGDGASVIGEFGQFLERTVASGNETTGRYFQIQGALRPFRGFYLYQTFEYLNDDIDTENYVMRIGPGFQWFLDQGLELRFDLLNMRDIRYPATPTTDDNNPPNFVDEWELLTQVHIWL